MKYIYLIISYAPLVLAEGALVGTPSYSGSGCPAGAVSSTLSPDASALSVLFDGYSVAAGDAAKTDQKCCNISIPVTVPAGYRVSLIGMDYRGFNNLPDGAQSTFSVTYSFGSSNTTPYVQTTSGPVQGDFLLHHTLDLGGMIFSDCGTNIVFKISNSISITTNIAGDPAMTSIDSADVSANHPGGTQGQVFYLQWDTCNPGQL